MAKDVQKFGSFFEAKGDDKKEPGFLEKLFGKGKKKPLPVEPEPVKEKKPKFRDIGYGTPGYLGYPSEEPEPEEASTDELPIQIDDWVVCTDFTDLTDKQIAFLKSKPSFRVKGINGPKSSVYTGGEAFIDIGYKIPLKMFRFKKVEKGVDAKYKILFLQFDLKIDTHGEEDTHNYFKGHTSMSDCFIERFAETVPDAFVEFCTYNDIIRLKGDYYIDDMKLKDYDFVFFGFMSSFTTIVQMLLDYLDRNGVPYLKYGTYKHLDNKAYEMHLVESLGYPYIPSILTSTLSKKVLDVVKEFGFPIIVKDVDLNRGEGVWKVENMKELKKMFNTGKLMQIQKHVPNDGDYRVITIKNKVALIIKKERIEGSGEFRANVARGGKAVKGTLPPEIIKMCEDISEHLVCDIIGFDVIQDMETKEYYIMETNSAPHFPTFAVISEVDMPGLIINYIMTHLKKKAEQVVEKIKKFSF